MTKIKETIKDKKDFILLCVTIILIAGWFCVSKIFDFFTSLSWTAWMKRLSAKPSRRTANA
jgi:hypothetical protein